MAVTRGTTTLVALSMRTTRRLTATITSLGLQKGQINKLLIPYRVLLEQKMHEDYVATGGHGLDE